MSTPYRNEIDALRERKTALEGEITRLRDQTTRLDELRAREAELAKELGAVDGRLAAGNATRRPLPLLDQVRVASPCKAEWNEMLGDERVRFCLGCEKNVYNLSSMQKEDAEALLRERLGNELCVRFYQRADGTILTQDCPEGVKKKRRKKLVLAVAGAGAMAAAAATMFVRGTRCTTGQGVATAGSAVYVPTEAPMMGEPTEVKGDIARPADPPSTADQGQWAGGAAVMTGVMVAPQPVSKTTAHDEPKKLQPRTPKMGRR